MGEIIRIPLRRQRLTHRVELAAEPGAVQFRVGETEVWISPAQARVWAARLEQMADTAERLVERE